MMLEVVKSCYPAFYSNKTKKCSICYGEKNMVCDNIKFTDSTSRIIIKTISANNSAYSLFFTSDQNIYHSF